MIDRDTQQFLAALSRRDEELVRRLLVVFRALERFNEGATTSFDPKTSRAKADARAPRETHSEYEYHLLLLTDLFRKVRGGMAWVDAIHKAWDICFLAERAYRYRKYGPPVWKRAGSGVTSSPEAAAERDERILAIHQGRHARDAAFIEECSERHIRDLRTGRRRPPGAKKYDATWGHPLPDDLEIAA